MTTSHDKDTGPATRRGADASPRREGADFIRAMVAEDVGSGRDGGRVATRFPPEPNGFLHIGHAKSICLNFGVAEEFGGACNLRFDDTNPETEDQTYVRAIKEDVRWLGFDWEDREFYASDYFGRLYELAEELIRKGKAYVDSLSEDEIREHRGTVTEPGRESPHRARSVDENLDLFRRMRAGEFPDGAHVLRAKIDMAAPNMLMRDPLLYRIRHAEHYRTGDEWCIYPMYDWAHPLSDALECITHSLCTLEFETHRELYDWVVDSVDLPCRPRQTEFARLNLDFTIMSKRKLLRLVKEGHVAGWDDPRMPTLAGLRRRGVTPSAIRTFSDLVGVARADSRVEISRLEYALRDDLNRTAPRVMAVLRPLRVVLENYSPDRVEELEAPYWPHDVPREGSRPVPFGRELFIERDDFSEDPPRGFRRMAPGREVRLRYAYVVRCVGVVRDEGTGEPVEVRCTVDPATRGGSTPDGRKVEGTIHWVSAEHALPAEVRLYDRLFSVPDPEAHPDRDFTDFLHPESLVTVTDARVEPSVASDAPDTRYQFERQGYFWRDPVDSGERLVFNRIVPLRDPWARRAAAAEAEGTEAGARGPGAEGGEPPAFPDVGSRGRAPREDAPSPRAPVREDADLSEEGRARRRRYEEELGLPSDTARLLAADALTAGIFEAALAVHGEPRSLANWVVNELPRVLAGRSPAELPFGGAALGRLVALVDTGAVSSRAAREVLEEMAEHGGEPASIVARRGLRQVSDAAALAPIVDDVLARNPDKVEAYRSGRTGLLGFFMGEVMEETRGAADPQVVRELVRERMG